MRNLLVMLALIASLSATAQTLNTWEGGKPGRESDWNIAANWSLNRVPDWTQDIFIPNLSTAARPYPVLSGQEVTINSLRLESGAALRITSNGRLWLPNGIPIEPGLIRGLIDSRFERSETAAGPMALAAPFGPISKN